MAGDQEMKERLATNGQTFSRPGQHIPEGAPKSEAKSQGGQDDGHRKRHGGQRVQIASLSTESIHILGLEKCARRLVQGVQLDWNAMRQHHAEFVADPGIAQAIGGHVVDQIFFSFSERFPRQLSQNSSSTRVRALFPTSWRGTTTKSPTVQARFAATAPILP